MSKVLVTESHLDSIAAAIRSKNGASTTYRPGDMASAIRGIDTSGIHPTGTKQITKNGVTDITQYASANVAVPNTYKNTDEGKVVSGGALVNQTSRTINANGTYNTTKNNQAVVNVPNSYNYDDEGKVVSNGALVSQTQRQAPITSNGTYQTKNNDSVVVNVPQTGSSPTLITKNITANGTYDANNDDADGYTGVVVNVPNSYRESDEGKVVSNGGLIAQSSTTKTANGTYDTTENNEVIVDVPNTYDASDEGKVIDNGSLVEQTSTTKNANGTYDTTTNNEVIVDVQPTLQSKTVTENGTVTPDTGYDGLSEVVVDVAGGVLITKNISANGTYAAVSDNADGYSSIVVDVPNEYLSFESGVTEIDDAILGYANTSFNIVSIETEA